MNAVAISHACARSKPSPPPTRRHCQANVQKNVARVRGAYAPNAYPHATIVRHNGGACESARSNEASEIGCFFPARPPPPKIKERDSGREKEKSLVSLVSLVTTHQCGIHGLKNTVRAQQHQFTVLQRSPVAHERSLRRHPGGPVRARSQRPARVPVCNVSECRTQRCR